MTRKTKPFETRSSSSSDSTTVVVPTPDDGSETLSESKTAPQAESAGLDAGYNFYGGIDLGVFCSRVCSSSYQHPLTIEVVPNDISARSTPSIISLTDNLRLVGEAADDRIMPCASTTFPLIPLLLAADTHEKLLALKKRFGPLFPSFSSFDGECRTMLKVGEEEIGLKPTQICAGFIRQLATFAVNSRNRQGAEEFAVTVSTGKFTLIVPDQVFNQGDTALKCITRACRTGVINVDGGLVCAQSMGIIACWLMKNLPHVWSDGSDGSGEKKVILVGFWNAGFSETSLSFLLVRDASVKLGGPGDIRFGEKFVFRMLSSYRGSEAVGVFDLVKQLAIHCEKQLAEKGCKVTAFSDSLSAEELSAAERKRSKRLYDLASKLTKDLSGLTLTGGMYMGADDIPVEITRETFEWVIGDELKQFKEYVKRTCQEVLSSLKEIQATGDYTLPTFLGVEIVGGGSRVPVIQKLLEEGVRAALSVDVSLLSFPAKSESLLRRTLDGDGSAAMGGTYIATGQVPMRDCPGIVTFKDIGEVWESVEQKEEYMHTEKRLRLVEQNELERLSIKNALEAKILEYETLSKKENVEGANELRQTVEKVSGWYYEAGMEPTVAYETYRGQLDELEASAQKHCSGYFEALRLSQLEKEKELDLLAAEQATQPKTAFVDTRDLPNSQRINLAVKNKDEGNELLEAGALGLAIQRYEKALAHLAKVANATAEETAEVRQLEVSCNLNLSQAYIREGSSAAANRALTVCESILSENPNHAKALFRRAHAHEKLKDYEAAKKDLKKCIQMEPTDAGILAALDRVDKLVQAEKTQRKGIFSRMFNRG